MQNNIILNSFPTTMVSHDICLLTSHTSAPYRSDSLAQSTTPNRSTQQQLCTLKHHLVGVLAAHFPMSRWGMITRLMLYSGPSRVSSLSSHMSIAWAESLRRSCPGWTGHRRIPGHRHLSRNRRHHRRPGLRSRHRRHHLITGYQRQNKPNGTVHAGVFCHTLPIM